MDKLFRSLFHFNYMKKTQWMILFIILSVLLFILWRLKKTDDDEKLYLIETMENRDKSDWVQNANQYSQMFGGNFMDQHLKYTGTPVPLPEGELFMFANNVSSPECCTSATYSTVDGCVCTSMDQLKYLNERGGNRTAYGGNESF
jgi:hypothetical protein